MNFQHIMAMKVQIRSLDNQLMAVTPPDMREEVKAEVHRLARTTAMSLPDALGVVVDRMKQTGSPYAQN